MCCRPGAAATTVLKVVTEVRLCADGVTWSAVGAAGVPPASPPSAPLSPEVRGVVAQWWVSPPTKNGREMRPPGVGGVADAAEAAVASRGVPAAESSWVQTPPPVLTPRVFRAWDPGCERS